ncbi:MAG: selenium-dependent molybdenum cofactor biosynthesis protein YqeB [Chloroflexota bacterium]
MAFFNTVPVVVLGGGDLASGVIYRLHRAGFPVFVTELPAPLFVRRTVCFGEAVYSGDITIEGVTARLADNTDTARQIVNAGDVAVLIDARGQLFPVLSPVVLVDVRMEKENLGITRDDAPLVIALGPGFTAGDDVHAVIETNRGHDLGRVIWQGAAEPDTGQPGNMAGKTHSRVLRSPADGHVHPHAQIGDHIKAGDTIADVNGEPIVAQFDGVLRGLIHERVRVWKNLKIGDLDPRDNPKAVRTISDKSLAVGGGVLEAVMSSDVVRAAMRKAHETAPRL